MKLLQGDCIDILKTLENNSIDSIVTDPPYGLSFMGKKWDYDVPSLEIWAECLRVLKPGGYLLSFAGTRTQHRMAVRIEDAGFEIRDMIAWIYGSGFPKSLNIGKAVARLQGEDIPKTKGFNVAGQGIGLNPNKELRSDNPNYVKPKFDNEWEGWGTALKPALEPITVARKPIEGTVAENCLKWGVGGINIDECRVATEDNLNGGMYSGEGLAKTVADHKWGFQKRDGEYKQPVGRFPANLIHDGSDEVVELFPNKSGANGGRGGFDWNRQGINYKKQCRIDEPSSASRFFYCAKASKSERNMGCEELEKKAKVFNGQSDKPSTDMKDVEKRFTTLPKANNHPTVKPIALMEYLIKLVSREGHTILDPFMGSGSTGIACKNLKRHFIGIEREPDYIKIAESRIEAVPKTLF